MEIKRPAIAGTLESSDCQVMVEAGEETLENLGVDDVKIAIVDKGALDCTIKARIEGAIFRSVKQLDNLPWGGAIR